MVVAVQRDATGRRGRLACEPPHHGGCSRTSIAGKARFAGADYRVDQPVEIDPAYALTFLIGDVHPAK